MGNNLLVDCAFDDAFCVDELVADWFYRGEQMVQIRRGCSKYAANLNCFSAEDGGMKVKDCQLGCTENACNNDMRVGDKFQGSFKETHCVSCKYVETEF